MENRYNGSLRCAVVADPHYYDPALGLEGPAFKRMLWDDRKMLKENKQLWDALIGELLSPEEPDIILVPGDITKDGERINHEKAASYFHNLQEQGKQVFVLPGNHDIFNPRAARYDGDKKIPVSSISPGEFLEIYRPFGYEQSFSRDPHSLSYAVELSPEYWLLALDSCIYQEQPEDLVVDGEFSELTLSWAEDILFRAEQQGKTVIAMSHHNVVPHIKGQDRTFSYTLAKNYRETGERLARKGLRILLTGHFHGQSISKQEGPGQDDFLYEIQTGSLVCYPSPYRVITVSPGEVAVETREVTLTAGEFQEIPFREYSREFLYSSLAGIIGGYMKKLHHLDDDAVNRLAPPFANAMVSFYEGGANGGEEARGIIRALEESGDPRQEGFAGMIKSLWFRELPDDNNIIIDLKSGNWRKS